MSYLFVADIGGTNARFGLVDISKDSRQNTPCITLLNKASLTCADYSNIFELISDAYAALTPPTNINACFAIAGNAQGDLACIEQLSWYFSIQELRESFGFLHVNVINDFAALAYSIPLLDTNDYFSIYNPEIKFPSAPAIVIGPGTGFGMAISFIENDSYKVISTAGGHSNFAPSNEKEWAVKAWFMRKQSFVSIETILSGKGLESIYLALADINGIQVPVYSSAEITNNALHGDDSLCREAALMFCDILGGVASDKAMSICSGRGVYIGGGIMPNLLDLLPRSNFINRYQNKGPMTAYAKEIPVHIITNNHVSLIGAATRFAAQKN